MRGTDPKLDFLYHLTMAHWLQWRQDYEHPAETWEEKPALTSPERLGRFRAELGVRRQIFGKGDNHHNWQSFAQK